VAIFNADTCTRFDGSVKVWSSSVWGANFVATRARTFVKFFKRASVNFRAEAFAIALIKVIVLRESLAKFFRFFTRACRESSFRATTLHRWVVDALASLEIKDHEVGCIRIALKFLARRFFFARRRRGGFFFRANGV
jgi:hypothetical protein